jgi:hypothetical protein
VELGAKLIVVGLTAWMIWLVFRPLCAFVVRFADGEARLKKGVATRACLEQIREICSRHGVHHGAVRGIVRGRRISLEFSRSIPASGQQQLRNWWALSGWAALPAAPQTHPRRA